MVPDKEKEDTLLELGKLTKWKIDL
jgi:hypothetical protein